MEFFNSTLTPRPHKLEHFESSMDLCPLESRKKFADKNSIAPLSESNRAVDECIHCYDRPDYECLECACKVCGSKTFPAKRYRCSSCKKVFHEWCQNNCSDAASASDHWQCMNCQPKDLVAPIKDELVAVKYTRQIIIRTAARKINNAPRSSECTIVPPNHFGPIPNIPVGTCWEYRLQASEAGVHRPLVAGIHGRENEGAYSIVLSGVYPDDFDNGDEFFYSGCGGKEKDPSKRLGAQVRNQMLTKQNRALALCCNCPLNDEKGGEAKNWRAGKPVRVIRNYKLAKFSKYAPTEGNRYDGIYKVVKYFPQKGHYGYMIWRYLLRRDDPTPAPWTDKGKRLIDQQGLKMIKASPNIVEEAEEFESTIKIEFNDNEPLKKTIKRVRRKIPKSTPKTPAKRPLDIVISSPKPSAKQLKQEFKEEKQLKQEFKEERMSPPPTPEPITIIEDTITDIKRSPPRLSTDDDVDYSTFAGFKSSPTHEPMTPVSIKSPERGEENRDNGLNPYLHNITSMEESASVCNTTSYTESPAVLSNGCFGMVENVHSMSTSFSQSLSSLSYLDNAYLPPVPLPKPSFLNSEPLPTLKGPPSSLLPSDTGNDFGFKPIKLTKPKTNIVKPVEPETENKDKSATLVMEKNGLYELTDHIKELIGKDTLNKCWWDLCLEKYLPLGKQSFTEKVGQIFTCPCCHKIVDKPVTLKCENRHSACLDCIKHRFEFFKARSCPSCQELFGPSTKVRVNENLSNILSALFPDYNLKLSYYI